MAVEVALVAAALVLAAEVARFTAPETLSRGQGNGRRGFESECGWSGQVTRVCLGIATICCGWLAGMDRALCNVHGVVQCLIVWGRRLS